MYMTATTPIDSPHEGAGGPQAEIRWIVDRENGGLATGRIGVLAIGAGQTFLMASNDATERSAFVMAGTGEAVHSATTTAIGPDYCLFVSRGRSLSVRAIQPLRLLVVEADLSAIAPAARKPPAGPRVVNAADIAIAPYHNPALGFLHVAARWLIDDALAGSQRMVVGQSQFAPASAHLFHRHDRAEEFFCVLEGNGVHLVEGGEVAMAPGDIVVVPRDEWHGFRNTGRALVRAVFGYLGTNSVEAGGYEVRPTASPT